jgi:hypothetical protein
LISTPIWEEVIGVGWMFWEVVLLIIIASGLSVTYSQVYLKVNLNFILGLLTIFLTIISFVFSLDGFLLKFSQYTQIAFFLSLTLVLFRVILKTEKVGIEVVFTSISGYLLIGLSWAILISIWSASFPDSFSFYDGNRKDFFDSVYFSFITMTTLGYGDFVPQTAAARAVSILVSISGTFYSVIVLGMIVGKFISNESIKQLKNKQ